MFLSTDNISELWEGINANPPICLQGFVSTGCLIHLNALGCDFKGYPWHFEFFLVGYRLQTLPIVRKHALALQFPCNVFLEQIIYFLQPERPLRIWRYANGQQAEKKSSVAEMFMLFVCQQSEFCVSLVMWFSWTIVLPGGCKINDRLITAIQSVPAFCNSWWKTAEFHL